jgi:hypothetical protein
MAAGKISTATRKLQPSAPHARPRPLDIEDGDYDVRTRRDLVGVVVDPRPSVRDAGGRDAAHRDFRDVVADLAFEHGSDALALMQCRRNERAAAVGKESVSCCLCAASICFRRSRRISFHSYRMQLMTMHLMSHPGRLGEPAVSARHVA